MVHASGVSTGEAEREFKVSLSFEKRNNSKQLGQKLTDWGCWCASGPNNSWGDGMVAWAQETNLGGTEDPY